MEKKIEITRDGLNYLVQFPPGVHHAHVIVRRIEQARMGPTIMRIQDIPVKNDMLELSLNDVPLLQTMKPGKHTITFIGVNGGLPKEKDDPLDIDAAMAAELNARLVSKEAAMRATHQPTKTQQVATDSVSTTITQTTTATIKKRISMSTKQAKITVKTDGDQIVATVPLPGSVSKYYLEVIPEGAENAVWEDVMPAITPGTQEVNLTSLLKDKLTALEPGLKYNLSAKALEGAPQFPVLKGSFKLKKSKSEGAAPAASKTTAPAPAPSPAPAPQDKKALKQNLGAAWPKAEGTAGEAVVKTSVVEIPIPNCEFQGANIAVWRESLDITDAGISGTTVIDGKDVEVFPYTKYTFAGDIKRPISLHIGSLPHTDIVLKEGMELQFQADQGDKDGNRSPKAISPKYRVSGSLLRAIDQKRAVKAKTSNQTQTALNTPNQPAPQPKQPQTPVTKPSVLTPEQRLEKRLEEVVRKVELLEKTPGVSSAELTKFRDEYQSVRESLRKEWQSDFTAGIDRLVEGLKPRFGEIDTKLETLDKTVKSLDARVSEALQRSKAAEASASAAGSANVPPSTAVVSGGWWTGNWGLGILVGFCCLVLAILLFWLGNQAIISGTIGMKNVSVNTGNVSAGAPNTIVVRDRPATTVVDFGEGKSRIITREVADDDKKVVEKPEPEKKEAEATPKKMRLMEGRVVPVQPPVVYQEMPGYLPPYQRDIYYPPAQMVSYGPTWGVSVAWRIGARYDDCFVADNRFWYSRPHHGNHGGRGPNQNINISNSTNITNIRNVSSRVDSTTVLPAPVQPVPSGRRWARPGNNMPEGSTVAPSNRGGQLYSNGYRAPSPRDRFSNRKDGGGRS